MIAGSPDNLKITLELAVVVWMSSPTYTRMDQVWRDTKHVILQNLDGSFLARIPMIYLEESGTNDWQLVYDIVQALVEEPIVILDLNQNEFSNSNNAPSPGKYTVRQKNHPYQAVTHKNGPEGKRRFCTIG